MLYRSDQRKRLQVVMTYTGHMTVLVFILADLFTMRAVPPREPIFRPNGSKGEVWHKKVPSKQVILYKNLSLWESFAHPIKTTPFLRPV